MLFHVSEAKTSTNPWLSGQDALTYEICISEGK